MQKDGVLCCCSGCQVVCDNFSGNYLFLSLMWRICSGPLPAVELHVDNFWLISIKNIIVFDWGMH